MQRVLLDSCITDRLNADLALFDALVGAIISERIEVLITHLQLDQNAATRGEEHRAALLAVLERLPATRLPTYGFALDVSRLDHGMLPTNEDAAEMNKIILAKQTDRNRIRTAYDVLLVYSARHYGADFVSEDQGARALALSVGVATYDSDGLRDRLAPS